MRGTVLMLCGLPGSGKTTLAKKLEKERNAVRLCPDEWIIPFLQEKFNIEEASKLRTPMEKLLLQLALRIADVGSNAILENGFWSAVDRNYYKEEIKKSGAKVELHFLDTPLKILKERIAVRNTEDSQFKLGAHELEQWYTAFEPPTEEEGQTYDYFKTY